MDKRRAMQYKTFSGKSKITTFKTGDINKCCHFTPVLTFQCFTTWQHLLLTATYVSSSDLEFSFEYSKMVSVCGALPLPNDVCTIEKLVNSLRMKSLSELVVE